MRAAAARDALLMSFLMMPFAIGCISYGNFWEVLLQEYLEEQITIPNRTSGTNMASELSRFSYY